jgi:hypothetical protein
MTTDAAAFEGQHYWWRGDIPTVQYSPASWDFEPPPKPTLI